MRNLQSEEGYRYVAPEKEGGKLPSQQLCLYRRERPANKVSDDTFTLQSSKGICAFEGDAFSCGPHVTAPEEFSVQDGKLSYRGNTTFFADKAPKGRTQSTIFASQDEHPIDLAITWKERR
jgi:ribonuclease T2